MALQQGAKSRDSVKVTYLNLHSGQLARTFSAKYVKANGLEETVKNWRKYKKVNKAEEEFHYYALDFPRITGYITSIKFFSKPLGDTTKTGYNIYVDCGDDGIFCIELTPNDRFAYRSMMSIMHNVNFENLCELTAFTNDKGREVFVCWQEDENGVIVPAKPKYKELWLSHLLATKAKTAPESLTEDDTKHFAFKADGKMDANYPYVRERKNPTSQKMEWNFDKWQEFLNEQFEDVTNRVKDANDAREANKGDASFNVEELEDGAFPLPEFAGMPDNAVADDAVPVDDDDIPFGLIIGLGTVGLSAIQLLANFNALLG